MHADLLFTRFDLQLNSLLYELHTLSFFLAPSLLIYLTRCGTQFQFAKTRELDGGRHSLAFWFALVLFANAAAVWTHAALGVPPGRTLVLDFVGMGAHFVCDLYLDFY